MRGYIIMTFLDLQYRIFHPGHVILIKSKTRQAKVLMMIILESIKTAFPHTCSKRLDTHYYPEGPRIAFDFISAP